MGAATCPVCGYVNKTGFNVKRSEKGTASSGWDHTHTTTCADCGKKFTIVERK